MSANGISTLATKELRQKAKLNLASADRQAINLGSNTRYEYDITELPTQYSGDNAVDNPNPGGLIIGRPWITPTGVVYHLLLAEDGTPLATESGDWINQQ